MNDKQFVETYCHKCGTQRCEGIGSEWFEGCKQRWNHDNYDAAAKVERLNIKIMDMAKKMVRTTPQAEWMPITKRNKKYGVMVTVGFTCSNCQNKQEVSTNYCSHCGAEMVGRR